MNPDTFAREYTPFDGLGELLRFVIAFALLPLLASAVMTIPFEEVPCADPDVYCNGDDAGVTFVEGIAPPGELVADLVSGYWFFVLVEVGLIAVAFGAGAILLAWERVDVWTDRVERRYSDRADRGPAEDVTSRREATYRERDRR